MVSSSTYFGSACTKGSSSRSCSNIAPPSAASAPRWRMRKPRIYAAQYSRVTIIPLSMVFFVTRHSPQRIVAPPENDQGQARKPTTLPATRKRSAQCVPRTGAPSTSGFFLVMRDPIAIFRMSTRAASAIFDSLKKRCLPCRRSSWKRYLRWRPALARVLSSACICVGPFAGVKICRKPSSGA